MKVPPLKGKTLEDLIANETTPTGGRGNPGKPYHFLTCARCGNKKPRAEFLADFSKLGTPEEDVTKLCRPCNLALIGTPMYTKNALTNIIRDALAYDDYAAARELAAKMISNAIETGDIPTIKVLLDRLDGPVQQEIIVDNVGDRRLIEEADALRAAIRGIPDEGSVH